MKQVLVALCAAFITTALIAAPPTPPVESAKPSGLRWLVTTSKKNDKLLLLKVREEIPSDAMTDRYPNVIEMHWKYAPDKLGMPAESVVSQIAKFEAAIDPIQGDRAGYLMTIVTGSGERTWLWYVADPKIFASALNRLVPGHPFPITLQAVGKEPDWKTYRALREKMH